MRYGALMELRMTDPHAGSPYTGEYVAARLEQAGMTLCALRVTGTRPAGLRCFWPAIPGTVLDAEDFVPAPGARRISEMDQMLGWIGLIPARDVHLRRIVGLRALTNPRTGKPVFSVRALGDEFGVSHSTVQAWCMQGWLIIATALNRPLFCHGPAFAAKQAQGGLAAAVRSHTAVSARARRVLESA